MRGCILTRDKVKKLYYGRRPIESNERARYSKRAASGKIQVIRGICEYCGHHKLIENINEDSHYFNLRKCAKCKKYQNGA